MEEDVLFEKLRSQSLKTVYNSLVYVRTKYLKEPNAVSNLCTKGGIKIIINLIEKPKLSDIALSILANCCLDDQVRKQVLKYNGITSLIRILRCLASESVQNRACRALSNLAVNTSCAIAIQDQQAIPLIIKFLQSTKDLGCQHTAVRALRILGNTEDRRNEIVEHEGILPIVELLNLEDSALKKECVRAIAWLTQRCTTECAQQVQEGQGLTALVTLCDHPENDICEYALTSLTNLTTQSAIRPNLGHAGAIAVFVDHIQNKKNRKPGLTDLITALCLCCRDSVNRIRIRDLDALNVFLNILNNDEYANLHERIIISLLAFRYDECSLNTLLDFGLVSTFCKHLDKFIKANRQDHVLISSKSECLTESPNEINMESDFDIDFNLSERILFNNMKDPTTSKEVEKLEEMVENVVPVTETNLTEDYEEGDLDSEVESVTSMLQKTSNSSKVFCIHSPSYQEIQNEQYETAASIIQNAFDACYWDGSSPGSIGSCFSPDRYSVDYSLPSPPSPYGVWSPAMSSKDEFQWSPLSVSSSSLSPTFINRSIDFAPLSSPSSPSSSSSPSQSPKLTAEVLRYSPVDEDHVSEEETEQFNDGATNVDSLIKPSTTNYLTDSKQNQSQHSTERDRRYNKRIVINSGFDLTFSASLPLSEQRKRRRMSSASDISGNSSLQTKERRNYHIGDYILLHLSHLSHMEQPVSKIATKECIEILLDYVASISTSISRAKRILIRITSNYYCFEYLISSGVTMIIHEKLEGQHNLDLCYKCNNLKRFQDKLLKNLSLVAESGFGIGELSHMLLTGSTSEQAYCILAAPYLVRVLHQVEQLKLENIGILLFLNKLDYGQPILDLHRSSFTLSSCIAIGCLRCIRRNLLQRLLIECYGLEILINLLKTDLFHTAVKSLTVLCQHFLHLPSEISRKNIQNDAIKEKDKVCKYASDEGNYDVSFLLDDGCNISAKRSQIVEKSCFFYTMLQGSFAESTQNIINLPEISKDAFNVILHHLYDCEHLCYTLNTSSVSMLMELVTVTDRLLLNELEKDIIKEIIAQLSPETVSQVYLYSKKRNCLELHEAALKYILVGNMKLEERYHVISTLLKFEETDGDIKSVINSKFPESKECPKYKKQRTT